MSAVAGNMQKFVRLGWCKGLFAQASLLVLVVLAIREFSAERLEFARLPVAEERPAACPQSVEEVLCKNVHHIKQAELDSLMPLVRKGMPINPAANRRACRDIQEYLTNKGRYWATAALEEGGKPTDKRVVINVSEGPVLSVALDAVCRRRRPGQSGTAADLDRHKQ